MPRPSPGTPGASVGTLVTGGTGSQIDATGPVIYVGPGITEATANVQRALVPMPAGTLGNLRVRLEDVGAVGTTTTVTVNVNGIDTAITCSISTAVNSCSDAVNTVVVVDGDAVAMRIEQTGTPLPTRVNFSLQIVP